jgi:hypothetical protein
MFSNQKYFVSLQGSKLSETGNFFQKLYGKVSRNGKLRPSLAGDNNK